MTKELLIEERLMLSAEIKQGPVSWTGLCSERGHQQRVIFRMIRLAIKVWRICRNISG